MTDLAGLGIAMYCIKSKKGRTEEWPITSFKSFLDLKEDSVSMASIELRCPLDHSFTLEEAVRAGIMPQAEAEKILAWAEQEFPRVKEDYEARVAEGRRARPSDYVPNEWVVAQGWRCTKCGAQAQSAGSPPQKQYATCLPCRADWANFHTDNKAAFDVFWNHTQSKLRDRFYALMRERFLADHPTPMSALEATALLAQWRKQARQESYQRRKKRPRQNQGSP